MKIDEQIKNIRKANNLTQEQFAEKIHVSRNAVAKWETGRGYPDIQNLLTISEEFNISLDELIKDSKLKDKVLITNSSKKWHLLVIIYLIAIIAYILYFLFVHKIFMIGFLISTIFMLAIELSVFLKIKIWKSK